MSKSFFHFQLEQIELRKSRTQLIKLQQGSIISKNTALVSRLKCNCKVIGDKHSAPSLELARKSEYRPRPLPRVTTSSKYTYVEKKAHKLSLGGRRRRRTNVRACAGVMQECDL
uniref:(northern house mosquito) hypothetical protein n=1 Tax=Culex pipiens TaxID=7175 RepID=A0A8D8D1P2_CULPI